MLVKGLISKQYKSGSIPKDLMEEEDAVGSRCGAPGSSPLKATFKRYKPHYKQAVRHRIRKERPDIMILIDTLTTRGGSGRRPVFIGRYNKNTRVQAGDVQVLQGT